MKNSNFVYRDGKYFVAKSSEGVASQGETEEEALRNLDEALLLYES